MSVIKSLFNSEAFFKEAYNVNPEYKTASENLDKLLDEADGVIPKKDKSFFSDMVRDQLTIVNIQLSRQAFEQGFSLAVQLIGESINK